MTALLFSTEHPDRGRGIPNAEHGHEELRRRQANRPWLTVPVDRHAQIRDDATQNDGSGGFGMIRVVVASKPTAFEQHPNARGTRDRLSGAR